MANNKFTKAHELDMLVAFRSAYEHAMRAYFCNNDYHSEALKNDVDDLLVLLHKAYRETNQVEE